MDNFFPKKGVKIAIALSGGVDSGVAAKLLVDKGYDLVSFHIHLWSSCRENTCCGGELLETARDTAKLLKIPFYEIDMKNEFKAEVVNKLIDVYQRGGTPNPCILCNKNIRFGKVLQWVEDKLKVDYLATGHYIKSIKYKSNNYHKRIFARAKDKTKDQSYFLYAINKKSIDKLVFPLGGYFKKDVWLMAQKWQLPVIKSKESFDLCFTNNIQKFLKSFAPNLIKKGEVLNSRDEHIGTHRGLSFYTIGQRAGFKINPKLQSTRMPKYYVIAKDLDFNTLIVGSQKESTSLKLKISKLNWFLKPQDKESEVLVKIRNTGSLNQAKIHMLGAKAELILDKPVIGVALGQSAVIYKRYKNQTVLIGGGIN